MLMDEKTREEVKKMLSGLQEEVKLLVFTQKFECQYCKDTRSIVQEIADLSDKISMEVYDFVEDKDIVEKYQIDKIPAIAVCGKEDYGIRFYGIPAGYEFTSLLESIKTVSIGTTTLSEETKSYLDGLKDPVHLKIFVTPTCPYCPGAVVLAHQMAYSSEFVKAEMIEVSEFPHLANKYGVQGVPRTVINEDVYMEGAAPDQLLTEKIQEAIGR